MIDTHYTGVKTYNAHEQQIATVSSIQTRSQCPSK